MNKNIKSTTLPDKTGSKEKGSDLEGYPLYPASEDIYNKYKNEDNIDPEDVSKDKVYNAKTGAGKNNEKDFDDDVSGSDLDIPGSEMDDELEGVGSEDEENNYYSIGGDAHDDLEEDNG